MLVIDLSSKQQTDKTTITDIAILIVSFKNIAGFLP